MRVEVSGAVYGVYGWHGFEAALTDEHPNSSYGQAILDIIEPDSLKGVFGPGDRSPAIVAPSRELPDGVGGTFMAPSQTLASPFPIGLISLHLSREISDAEAEWLREVAFRQESLTFRPGHSTIRRIFGAQAANADVRLY